MTDTGQAQVQTTGRPIVSLGELQRAWEAVQAGGFRCTDASVLTSQNTPLAQTRGWFPTETVIPVIGAGGGVGATTLTLALAMASAVPVRVVECCSAPASGLASASTAELGEVSSGWRRGLRDGSHRQILLERTAAPIPTAAAVPLPIDPDRPVTVTFLDCSWGLDHLLVHGWLAQLVSTAPVLVVAATATVPGLRRLEVTLDALKADHADQVHVGVRGPRRRKWAGSVAGSFGPATRSVDAHGGLVEIPLDRHLATHGLTSAPLPQPLLSAAGQLLDRLPAPTRLAGQPR
jgi:hypothetical protein